LTESTRVDKLSPGSDYLFLLERQLYDQGT